MKPSGLRLGREIETDRLKLCVRLILMRHASHGSHIFPSVLRVADTVDCDQCVRIGTIRSSPKRRSQEHYRLVWLRQHMVRAFVSALLRTGVPPASARSCSPVGGSTHVHGSGVAQPPASRSRAPLVSCSRMTSKVTHFSMSTSSSGKTLIDGPSNKSR
jgi:hypothetical protein